MEYTVTFYEHPDQTGRQIHVYTWSDSSELAAEFAQRQVDWLDVPFPLHAGEATPIVRGTPDVK